ncbi:saccharopine dehydrogenase C-terminal domain-containing protein [Rhizosaccharibacter radicis]|uniref:Saccharopine dehydrogenase NADP-binding domain-containing protein n=1 Tax=Rhizosaccharibacter radicis TaxID=2782605 RepID=A0ABT1W1H9_9PROT|nr:saccharopine dehydrogenase NADP-binding domain-containing protein [Acetobacteraceae bacterium KSS12]
MRHIAIVGAGKIGGMIAELLAASGSFEVTVVDRDAGQLDRLRTSHPVRRHHLSSTDAAGFVDALRGSDAVLNAAPFSLTTRIADAAAATGAHYLDLTEDVASTRHVRALSETAAGAFIPQCGLAPGFITIAAHDLARRFDELHDVRLRVGALPQFPSNALGYNLTWSTDGVINEYCEPCEAIVDGVLRHTTPLEECEQFVLDGVAYEAFNTSGGLGSLCDTLRGEVRTLNYRTIRYPGHAAAMKMLLNDLGLRHRRDVMKDILEHAIPVTLQDVVVIFVTVTGLRDGRLMQESYVNRVHAAVLNGVERTAIQLTTASSICAVLDLLRENKLPRRGFVRQEDIALPVFLANRFGRLYDPAIPPASLLDPVSLHGDGAMPDVENAAHIVRTAATA